MQVGFKIQEIMSQGVNIPFIFFHNQYDHVLSVLNTPFAVSLQQLSFRK